jgi:PhnB protein
VDDNKHSLQAPEGYWSGAYLWFGEKVCRILDPFGNLWWINQRTEEVDLTNPEEVKKRSITLEAVNGIKYIQKSLDEAMKSQKKFFKTEVEI